MALRKQIRDAQQRLVELDEPVWEVFIAKHNDKEEAREQKQRRKAAVAALPSEEDASSDRSDPRLSTSDPPMSAAIDTRHLAGTWRHRVAQTTLRLVCASQARH